MRHAEKYTFREKKQNKNIALHQPKVEVSVYPNPTTGAVNIQLPESGKWQIVATDISGRIVWKQSCNGCAGTIKHELNNAKGLYFIKITNLGKGEQYIKKVTLQ